MKKNNILNYVLIFLVVYVVLGFFNQPKNDYVATGANFDISTTKKDYGQNEPVEVKIRNNTQNQAIIKNECPSEPLTVLEKSGGNWQELSKQVDMDCAETADTVIEPGQEGTIHYNAWAHAIFGEIGTYKIAATIEVPDDPTKSGTVESNEFVINPQGWLGTIWTVGFYQPIYNVLIFLTSIIPGHDLGLAIILLTIIIRTILLLPSHKAMKSQRKLQEIQPKLNKLKEKYKDNQEALARETMLIWKEHKVNPLGSCLPLLIQLPLLIALYNVIQTGLNPDNSYLLYGPLQQFSIKNINVLFVGILDLTKINAYVLPLIVGGLQFAQMKLAMMRTAKKNADQGKEKKKEKNDMEMANSMMVYFMPIMIALFTASVPAGVGLYWCVSTIYGIVQQYVVNKQVADEKPEGGVKVRVVKN